MIIKSKGHRHTRGIFKALIEYIHSDKGRATENNSFSFFHNILSNQVDEIITEFKENAEFRKKRKNGVVHHIMLSFSPKDKEKITPEILQELIEKFIELRGDSGLYYGRLHNSEGRHPHVHLILSGNEYRSDKSMRVSKARFKQIHHELEVFQKQRFSELSNSLVKIGEIDFSERPRGLSESEKHIASRGEIVEKVSLKNRLLGLIEKADNTLELYDSLIQNGFKLFERKGRINGIISTSGKKFRFTTLGIAPKTIRELDEIYLDRFHSGRERDKGRDIPEY